MDSFQFVCASVHKGFILIELIKKKNHFHVVDGLC